MEEVIFRKKKSCNLYLCIFLNKYKSVLIQIKLLCQKEVLHIILFYTRTLALQKKGKCMMNFTEGFYCNYKEYLQTYHLNKVNLLVQHYCIPLCFEPWSHSVEMRFHWTTNSNDITIHKVILNQSYKLFDLVQIEILECPLNIHIVHTCIWQTFTVAVHCLSHAMTISLSR